MIELRASNEVKSFTDALVGKGDKRMEIDRRGWEGTEMGRNEEVRRSVTLPPVSRLVIALIADLSNWSVEPTPVLVFLLAACSTCGLWQSLIKC